mmetsp:Transcript_24590/g.84852  ORF Transcript_24590/g.84852 Transcript_24590/m.84852 type:complete len:229 (-) Transcript_24590:353-1039(-)
MGGAAAVARRRAAALGAMRNGRQRHGDDRPDGRRRRRRRRRPLHHRSAPHQGRRDKERAGWRAPRRDRRARALCRQGRAGRRAGSRVAAESVARPRGAAPARGREPLCGERERILARGRAPFATDAPPLDDRGQDARRRRRGPRRDGRGAAGARRGARRRACRRCGGRPGAQAAQGRRGGGPEWRRLHAPSASTSASRRPARRASHRHSQPCAGGGTTDETEKLAVSI